MHLCCMKNKGIHTSFLVLNKIIIALMVFIFTIMPVLEVFHNHESSSEIETETVLTNTFSVNKKTSFKKPQLNCKFCHQLSHHQPTSLLSISSISLVYFTNSNSLISNHTFQKTVLLPGVSWTNKGPPAQSC